ncbi:hypothetical protein I311_01865 [Cryptococcus gattii NT-10]|nr:hypothetical protein I311_01865 [Cryptococcus gattii NT-10]
MAKYSGIRIGPTFAQSCKEIFKSDCKPELTVLGLCSFENLVNTAIRKCAEDDQFALLKSKPTNDELRGRAIDYLDSVVREKKKAEATKRAETTVKSIKSRTARFRMWLASNWKSTPLDSCKERDLLKRALLPDNGILRNLHFLEHDEADIFKSPTESRSGSAEGDEDGYDEFLLLADIHHGGKVDRPGWAAIEPWWWSPIRSPADHTLSSLDPPSCVDRLRELAASPGKVEAQVNSCLPSAAHVPGNDFMDFRLPCGHMSLEDRPVGLFHPIAEYTKGMIDWDAAQKMDASHIPSYKDVPSDPARSQSRQCRRPLLEILQNNHSSVYTSLQKRLILLPQITSYTLRSLWESRCGEGVTQYESRLQRAITGVRYRSFSEYLDAASATALDSSLDMEGVGSDSTQDFDAFGNFDDFVGEGNGEEEDWGNEEL